MVNAVLIKVDRDTHSRLKGLAGQLPLARYLRDLSFNLSGETPAPLSPIEKKLSSIESRLDSLQTQLLYFSRVDSFGEQVPVYPMRDPDVPTFSEFVKQAGVEGSPVGDSSQPETQEQLQATYDMIKQFDQLVDKGLASIGFPMVDCAALQDADEKQPDGELDIGFYHRDIKGKWHFNRELASRVWQEERDRSDAELAKYAEDKLKKSRRRSGK